VPHGELTAKNGSIPSRNKKEEAIKRGVTDRHPDRQSQLLTIMTPSQARRSIIVIFITVIFRPSSTALYSSIQHFDTSVS